MMKDEITHVLRKQFQAGIDKHAMNVRIMMKNPMAIHEHTDFIGAIEIELEKIAEYKDKLEAMEHI
jgi:hypothetical protein